MKKQEIKFKHDTELGCWVREIELHDYKIVEAKSNPASHETEIIKISKNNKTFSVSQFVYPSRYNRFVLEREGEFLGILVKIKRPVSTAGKILGIMRPGDPFPMYLRFKDLNPEEGISIVGMEQVAEGIVVTNELAICSKDDKGQLSLLISLPITKNLSNKPISNSSRSYRVFSLGGYFNSKKYLKQLSIRVQ